MSNDNLPGDPFGDYINASLDMEGIRGLDHTAIAERVRSLLPTLPENATPELWDEQLNTLQSVIRICLDLDTVLGAFKEQPDSGHFTRDDLESLIMLSVTFAFVSYNQLQSAYNLEEAYTADNTQLACRLRATLQVALGWVRRSAHDGDPIATRFTEEIVALLDASDHLK
ncbi:MAG: hypothetical protein ABI835_14410 [Chloroflexota bacterium]